jgi:UDP-3-O-[3-hydroxymyristoyl] N-acetylglucosamine deacetylase
VGIHTGEKVYMTLRPAAVDTGIVFRRVDLPQPGRAPRSRRAGGRHQPLHDPGRDGVRVATVEHLLSAMAGLGIDNAYVDLSAAEVRSWTAARVRSCS